MAMPLKPEKGRGGKLQSLVIRVYSNVQVHGMSVEKCGKN